MAALMPNLRDYLLTVDDLTAIVDEKIRPGAINQTDTYPYIVITLVTTDDNQTLDGATDFIKETIEIQTFSLSYKQADQIAEIIRLNLNGFQQKLMGELYINSTIKTNEWTFTAAPETGDNKWIFSRATIYDISYPLPDNVAHP